MSNHQKETTAVAPSPRGRVPRRALKMTVVEETQRRRVIEVRSISYRTGPMKGRR